MNRLRRGLIDLRPLGASPDFRRLWAGGLVSGLAMQMSVVAVLYQVWEMTRSPVWVGTIGLVQAVPMIVLGLVGGAVADALDRRAVVVRTTALQSLVALALALQAVLDVGSLALVLGLVALQSGAGALGAPARRTFVSRLLPPRLLAAGIALHMIGFQAAMMVGPALGGLAIGALGVGACYALNAVGFLVSLWAVHRLPPMPPGFSATREGERRSPRLRLRPVLSSLVEGVRTTVRRPVLRGSFLTDLAATLLAFPVALFPMVNELRFGGDPTTLGLFLSALAVGGLLAGVWSGSVTRAARLGWIQLLAASVWGLALAGFGLAGPLWLALAMLALAGAADTTSVTTRAAMVQLDTDDRVLGRVASVEHVIAVAGPDLGNFRAGVVAGWTSPAVAATSGGVLCVLAVLVVALSHPQVARFRVGDEHRDARAG
ncbi:MFS transporter [Ornithinimicrobium avium]|uniref:MFS transporter n=1 Tax=Ornithinimicrobium avium TaxID=2283195 RepID=A0A345NM46_9MICO|nr:MFS transporter [Ornithinimicrobium avium]AXH96104.1 MFS transporter [Ornithinimicrobium avium]